MSSEQLNRTWPMFGWLVLQQLHKGWMCFDKWAGWLIGLDNSKYQWALAEYHLQQQEFEREADRRLDTEDNLRQQMEEGLQADPEVSRQVPVKGQQLELTNPSSNTITR
ncbi:hypothetical protein Vafri_19496 [Volvox africanus]|uniref:Uncharacterized protein n=1 Tax=Volvox africanus TaxID=51714 RepID=A0A8J4BRM9_9CHLO|nr:hypothetical protein Vafri_19496 [Volvox africanus]